MTRIFSLLLLSLVAAALPPMPPAPATNHVAVNVSTNKVLLKIGLPRTTVLTFRYPAGLDPLRYNWQVETSTNLRDWLFYSDNTNAFLTISPNDRQRFYRTKGVPK